ncbi:MAG: hypothetical protein JSS98_19855 [Bacteroidetes bacterium]|nr:hypothetical protein [Bacteroidota bacterium]
MRTPPQEQGERVEEDRGKQEIITGIMEKLGYLTGEMLIEGEAEKKERIKIIGSRHSGQK